MNPYARLPRMDDLLSAAADVVAAHGRDAVRRALDEALDDARDAIAAGRDVPDDAALLDRAAAALRGASRPGPAPLINASGVVIHTNLGRAPLSPAAIEAMRGAAGYCDLEFDLDSGGRGSRGDHVDALLAEATGAEDAMVVNNCAAALVLVLAALAASRQVVVSRGHLVEIGGSFRLPDIMAASTAELLEVGTTNRTRATDYGAGDRVAALLTVHPSNFTQEGFVTQPSLTEVAVVARERGVPLIHDAGSGLLTASPHPALANEPSMADALIDADAVVASGDKLLGGPQAGLIVGRAELIGRCRRHPLARALRVDKVRLAALSATLVEHRAGRPTAVDGMLAVDAAHLDALADRARAVADAVGGHVASATTMIGGGSAPGVGVDSPVVRLPHRHAGRVAEALRTGDPPVVTRVEDGAVVVDLRTVPAEADPELVERLRDAVAAGE